MISLRSKLHECIRKKYDILLEYISTPLLYKINIDLHFWQYLEWQLVDQIRTNLIYELWNTLDGEDVF